MHVVHSSEGLGTNSISFLEYAFYIDSKGNRLFNKFLIEWEGAPESFAFSYPFVMAFDSSFIEIRNVVTVSVLSTIQLIHDSASFILLYFRALLSK